MSSSRAIMRAMDGLPPEAFLAIYPDPMRRIAERLRGVVRRAVPDATERVRVGWRVIGYDVPTAPRRTRLFAFVWPEPEHVHIGFQHGTLMDDPLGILEGHGVTKQVRWVTFRPGDPIDEPVLRSLLLEAVRVAGLTRSERVAIALDRDEDR
jgi:hypothetical protein